eukprot:3265988-Rhodomonas_salina.2
MTVTCGSYEASGSRSRSWTGKHPTLLLRRTGWTSPSCWGLSRVEHIGISGAAWRDGSQHASESEASPLTQGHQGPHIAQISQKEASGAGFAGAGVRGAAGSGVK